jgi:hypothetical protein
MALLRIIHARINDDGILAFSIENDVGVFGKRVERKSSNRHKQIYLFEKWVGYEMD